MKYSLGIYTTSLNTKHPLVGILMLVIFCLISQPAWSKDSKYSILKLNNNEGYCQEDIGLPKLTQKDYDKIGEQLAVIKQKAADIKTLATGESKIWFEKFLKEMDTVNVPSKGDMKKFIAMSKAGSKDSPDNIKNFNPVRFSVTGLPFGDKLKFIIFQSSQTGNKITQIFDGSLENSIIGDVGQFRKLICLTSRTRNLLVSRTQLLSAYSADIIKSARDNYANYRRDVLTRQLPWEYALNNFMWKSNCYLDDCNILTGTLNGPPKAQLRFLHPTPMVMSINGEAPVNPRAVVEVIGIEGIDDGKDGYETGYTFSMIWAPSQDAEEGHGYGVIGGYGKYSVGLAWHEEDKSTSILFGLDVVKLFDATKTKLNEKAKISLDEFEKNAVRALALLN
ncbi:MAG: hypothetical protein HQL71_11470 [Magnetococcales bacterium]|nr:hypothetical protein [Magnetococcales bacterium]